MINLIKSAINSQDRGDILIEVAYDNTEQNIHVKLHNTKPVSHLDPASLMFKEKSDYKSQFSPDETANDSVNSSLVLVESIVRQCGGKISYTEFNES